jgi:hypothetical protein
VLMEGFEGAGSRRARRNARKCLIWRNFSL